MKKIIPLFLSVLIWGACSDFLNTEPKNAVTYSNFFKTEQDINTAAESMHSVFRTCFGDVSPRLYLQRALPFDYLDVMWEKLTHNNFKDTYGKSNPSLYWEGEYKTIAMANMIIGNIHKAGLSPERYNFYLGQAYVIRAYTYFRTIQLWGNAPIVKNFEDVSPKERRPWTEVCSYIIQDLKKAIEILPPVSGLKDINGNPVTDKQIPSQGTAWAILAYVYGWQAQLNNQPELLTEAIKACDTVINSGEYVLADNIEEVCEKVMYGNSPEGIFELNFSAIPREENTKGACIAGAAQQYPAEPLATPATPRFYLAIRFSTVFGMYTETDERRSYFYNLEETSQWPESQTQGYAYLYKYRHFVVEESGFFAGEIRAYTDNEILIRLSGLYLLRAEYRAKTGDAGGAIADLNVVRRRAKAPEYSAGEGELRKVISLERRKELFGEGDNFLELLREGFEGEVPGFKNLTPQDIQEGRIFIPLSSMAFENNTRQTQYPYWEKQGY